MRELSPAELEQRVRERRRELFQLRVQQAMAQLDNPQRLRQVRREIARLLTVLTEKTSAPRKR